MEIQVYAVVRGDKITMVSDRKHEIQNYVNAYNKLKHPDGPKAEVRAARLRL